MTTTISDATRKLLVDRLLLPGDMPDYYPEQFLIVTTGDALGDTTHAVKIKLTAVGLPGDALAGIYNDLAEQLRAALRPFLPGNEYIDASDIPQEVYDRNPWIHRVAVQPDDNGETELLVEVNDSSRHGAEGPAAVMDIVQGLLTPVAKRNWRQLVVLRGGERYVPLCFEMDDLFRRTMSVTLPEGLEVIDARRFGAERDDDLVTQACLSLAATLECLMSLTSNRVGRITARRQGDKVVVHVAFKQDGVMPKPADINAVRCMIADVLTRQTSYRGFYDRLIFGSELMGPDEDGDYDEDRGFLNEYREY